MIGAFNQDVTVGELAIQPLRKDLPFGARVSGLDRRGIGDPAVREQLVQTLDRAGMIVFEDVEPTGAFQVLLSNVFGPLKKHPVKVVERVDEDKMPGVITIRTEPDAAIVEIEGKRLMTWQPWHFDHSYNNELNRAGVLRAEAIAPQDGMTAFADGIQIYEALSPETRAELEAITAIYTLDLAFERQPFGLPPTFRQIQGRGELMRELGKTLPRALHPAVWTRDTGEKVVHLSPFGARGIAGDETPGGMAKLSRLWGEVEAAIVPYHHTWRPTDMLIWDNWRMLHMGCGCDPRHDRVMHRTTIQGDYGLGRWETDPVQPAGEMTVM